MTQRTINGKEYVFVEVPEFSHEHIITRNGRIVYWDNVTNGYDETEIIGHSKYSVIDKADQLTESQWRKIIQLEKGFGFRDYDAPNGAYQWSCPNAIKSGHSLIKSLSMKLETTLILSKTDK